MQMLKVNQGQVYKSKRIRYTVEYVNDHIVILQYGDKNHRLENRQYFESAVEAGQFEPEGTVERTEEETESVETGETDETEVPFEDISWVGEGSASSLRASGLRTAEDIRRASDERLLSCDSVGERSVENIRDWVKNNG